MPLDLARLTPDETSAAQPLARMARRLPVPTAWRFPATTQDRQPITKRSKKMPKRAWTDTQAEHAVFSSVNLKRFASVEIHLLLTGKNQTYWLKVHSTACPLRKPGIYFAPHVNSNSALPKLKPGGSSERTLMCF